MLLHTHPSSHSLLDLAQEESEYPCGDSVCTENAKVIKQRPSRLHRDRERRYPWQLSEQRALSAEIESLRGSLDSSPSTTCSLTSAISSSTSSSSDLSSLFSAFLPVPHHTSHRFDAQVAQKEQPNLTQLEAHVRWTLSALRSARRKFMLQFGFLVCLALASIIYWFSLERTVEDDDDDPSNNSGKLALMTFGCSFIGLLIFIATGTAADRMTGVESYTRSLNRWYQLFGLEWTETGFKLEPLPKPEPHVTHSRRSSKNQRASRDHFSSTSFATTAASTSASSTSSTSTSTSSSIGPSSSNSSGASTNGPSSNSTSDFEYRKRCGIESGWAKAMPC